MIIVCSTLLPNDRAQAILAETGTTTKQTTVTKEVTDAVVALIMTTASTDSKFEVGVL